MLLMQLETKEKFSFLQLAHYLARIDKNFGEKEEEIILEYCSEMGIDNIDIFDEDSFCLETVLNDFKSKKSQKIVLLELMILIHIDNNFDINEKEFIKNICDKFDISLEDADDFSQWGKSVAMLYQVAKIFINEKKEA
ncbi:TerB family tellurite resistance protein [Arcobacter roscoffensis]|uniref:TerB family tellurite resistance protein n=1 Tax=Arcobacter roscoffensis TaxID=2961520 RepID=A0ABY5E973_9BACT|nr:TerB family tellurite resistance protein [Arcobacter roscoffensis]UTJ07720.1 TerB family tellurite resistance protein [Arcobacter roscoffensis]